MKESKITRRHFLKVGAVASAAGLLSAAPVAASAAAPALTRYPPISARA
jgi:alkaline phosphatase